MVDAMQAGYFLTDEDLILKQTIREYCEANVLPHVKEADGPDYKKWYHKWMKELGDLDVWRMAFPEEAGGMDGRLTTTMIIAEELARACGGLAIHGEVQIGHSLQIAQYYPQLWANGYAEKLMSGEWSIAGAFNAPEGQVNFPEQQVVAKHVGNEWVLNGIKCFSSVGPMADVIIALGLTEDGSSYGFVITNDTPGVTMSEHREVGNSPTYATYNLKEVHVPESHAADVGIATNRKTNLCTALDKAKGLTTAAGAIGTMDAAFEMTLDYLTNRTYNFKPIASLGQMQRKLVEMKADIESVRALTWTAARKIEAQAEDGALYGDLAKSRACETSRRITDECIQMFGCLGIDPDTGIVRYHLDSIGASVGACTPDMHYSAAATHMGLPGADYECL